MFKYTNPDTCYQTSQLIDQSEQNKKKRMEHKIKILVIGVMIAAITIGVIIVGKEE